MTVLWTNPLTIKSGQFTILQAEEGGGSAERELVSWCFEPSQPQRIISGLRKTVIKRCIVERTNEAEIRLEEESEKAQIFFRIYGMRYS